MKSAAVKREKMPLTWKYENDYSGLTVCGVDEAGRGPLAGRVYAAAVILSRESEKEDFFKELDDSKKLTEKKRFELAKEIKKNAVSWSVAYSETEEIERLNILEASLLAMRRAVDGLSVKPDAALIDGNICRGFDIKARAVTGGDGLSPSIAAASILAKTERDIYCIDVLDKLYPEYGFAKHKGYGTKAHYEAINKYGLCPEHRKSFLKKCYER